MELIRKAANSDGDYVVFRRLETKAKIIHEVVLYNSRTGNSLTVYLARISSNGFGRKIIERSVQAEGLKIFEKACDFMGIESGLDKAKGDG